MTSFDSEFQKDLGDIVLRLNEIGVMTVPQDHEESIRRRLNVGIDGLEKLRDRLNSIFTCPFCGNTFIPTGIDTLDDLITAYQEQALRGWSTDCTLYHLHKMLSTHFKNEDELASARQAVEKKEQF